MYIIKEHFHSLPPNTSSKIMIPDFSINLQASQILRRILPS